jgi:hypothetical protein
MILLKMLGRQQHGHQKTNVNKEDRKKNSRAIPVSCSQKWPISWPQGASFAWTSAQFLQLLMRSGSPSTLFTGWGPPVCDQIPMRKLFQRSSTWEVGEAHSWCRVAYVLCPHKEEMEEWWQCTEPRVSKVARGALSLHSKLGPQRGCLFLIAGIVLKVTVGQRIGFTKCGGRIRPFSKAPRRLWRVSSQVCLFHSVASFLESIMKPT